MRREKSGGKMRSAVVGLRFERDSMGLGGGWEEEEGREGLGELRARLEGKGAGGDEI